MPIALPLSPPSTETKRRSTLTSILPATFPSARKPAGTPVSDRHAKGLEAVNAARATLARMLGALELFAFTGPDEQDLDDVRQDAASIATNLCEITAAFVAVATDDEPAQPHDITRRVPANTPSAKTCEMRARLDQICSFPATTMSGLLLETSMALNKMASAFMRVAGCIDLDTVDVRAGYDPNDDIRSFPRLLTEATAALQAGDYELGHVRSHQRLLASLLSELRDDRVVAKAMDDCGELGPLRSFLEEMLGSNDDSSRPAAVSRP